MDTVNLPLILAAAFVSTASPGPATLTIAGTSMAFGRISGLAVAAGVTTGSWLWSVAAALGLGAVMLANVWAFELLRYAGAAYLLYLAVKSARSAFKQDDVSALQVRTTSLATAYGKGLLLHLTNPKAILFFGALFAIGVPAGASTDALALVIFAVGLQSFVVFHGYALLFSSAPLAAAYARLRQWFEAIFALAFGAAGLKFLTARLEP
ncbi:MAG: LysE family transporter [Pseudomonadota bacterium]